MTLQGEITRYPEMCAEHGVPRSASAPASSVSAFFTTLSGQCARACPLRQCRADGAACGPFTAGGSPQAAACLLPSQVAAAQVGGFPPGMQSCVPAGCLVASDCASSYCNPVTMECDQRTAAQQCSDGEQTTTETHGETDVDCGGTIDSKELRTALLHVVPSVTSPPRKT